MGGCPLSRRDQCKGAGVMPWLLFTGTNAGKAEKREVGRAWLLPPGWGWAGVAGEGSGL